MKKLVFSLVVLSTFMLNDAIARNVSEQEAREVAACYMQRNTKHDGVKVADLALMHQIQGSTGVAAYCYNVSDWGWIIINGNTTVTPVLGFGDEGNLGSWESLAPAMRWWVEGYAADVAKVQQMEADGEKFDDEGEWESLLGYTVTSNGAKDDPRVILMTSYWEQGENYGPTYNYFCPFDSATGKYCYTGCVATAMSQIVRYYGFPKAPRGRVNYYTETNAYHLRLKLDTIKLDYTQMPSRLRSTSTDAEIYNVAMLNYICGIIVSMDYTPDGSGSQSDRVPGNMAGYMKYEEGTYLLRSNTTTSNFITKIREDLLLRRPVYMSGYSPNSSGRDAGHAWVCCGYRTDNDHQYYMNWGWGTGGNGFFDIYTNTTQSMAISGYGYSFTQYQGIVTGMVPPSPDSSDVDFMTPIDVVDAGTVLAPAYPNPSTMNVTLPYSVNADMDMTVYSIDGKLMTTRRLHAGTGAVTLSTAEMPAGIYIYRVGSRCGKFIVR